MDIVQVITAMLPLLKIATPDLTGLETAIIILEIKKLRLKDVITDLENLIDLDLIRIFQTPVYKYRKIKFNLCHFN